MGNCEFFFLDTRANANSPVHAFHYDDLTNVWSFQPPPGHSILGAEQMEWLKTGLQNSTADWKFIVGGVPFNPQLKMLIDFGLEFQDLPLTIAGNDGTGFRLAASFAGYWAGYPEDVETLTNFVSDNKLRNLIFISGDTHHNVMDDGTNSFFPELNASGLSVTGTNLAYFIDLFAPLFGFPAARDSLWNRGGNGLGNMNFKNAFGKIEVFGNDSVRLCVIDEDNLPISCFSVPFQRLSNPNPDNTEVLFTVNDPVAAGQTLFIRLFNPQLPLPTDRCYLTDLSGRMVGDIALSSFSQGESNVQLPDLPTGIYHLTYQSGSRVYTEKLLVR